MYSYRIVKLLFLLLIIPTAPIYAQTNNEIFEKMLGAEIIMDTDITAKVLLDEPGEKFTVDTDGDGQIDTIYMIDNDDRHNDKRSPLLVKIVDEDGDMHITGEGDLDSDLYIADWYGDGTIDRVIDYIDHDNDNDLDEQVMYQTSHRKSLVNKTPKKYNDTAYFAVWARDYGDDNRLWFDANYEYDQTLTQWLTDFNGDEMFVYLFAYDFGRNIYTPAFENAFSFYDLDGDSFSEEVVRFTGWGPCSDNLRYSMDIDNDSRGSNKRDYDFSISCLGPIDFPLEKCVTLEIRGIKTEQIIKWEHMRQVAKEGNWKISHLTWDENDNNVDPVEDRQHNERWEGVLSHGNEYIKGVGGPSCGPYNKRNEVDKDNSGRFRLYYSPVDRRFHLFGAEVGWIKVDYDYDSKVDMYIHMEDENENGFFDTWKYDIDADSTFDREFRLAEDTEILFPFDYNTLHDAYMPTLNEAVKDNQKIIEVMKAVLKKYNKNFALDPIEDYFHSSLIQYGTEFHLGEKIKNSIEGTRYYGDLIRERYWHQILRTPVVNVKSFPETLHAYETGDFLLAARLLQENILKSTVANWYGSYQKRFAIEITNPGKRFLEYHPIVLDINEIRQSVSDFNPSNFVIVEAEPRVDWRLIPSQADDLNGDKKPDELVFVHSLLPSSTTNLYCYYSPEGSSAVTYPSKTGTNRDWSEARSNIGWESNRCCYRMYNGQIDFFGKRGESLILNNIKDMGNSYHHISDWGMDVLIVGKSSGLGGISIWEDNECIPVINPVGEGTVNIERRILSNGPVRSLVRVDFSNILSGKGKYTVSLMMSAFADNSFSRQDITITSTSGDSVVYSPGLLKLPNDTWFMYNTTGVLSNWGSYDPEAKDIGLGLMFDPGEYSGYTESDLDRFVKLKIPVNKQRTHWILGGWRKGFSSPVAPTGRDWANKVEELALQLRTPVHIEYLVE